MSIRNAFKRIIKEELSDKCSDIEINNLLNSLNSAISSYFQLINSDGELELVHIEDVCYIDRERNNAIFYTIDKQYTQSLPFDIVKKLTANFQFEISDQKILVNVNKVILFDEYAGKVYFDENNMKFYTFVSSRNVAKFRRFGRQKEIKNSTTEKLKKNMESGTENKLFSFL